MLKHFRKPKALYICGTWILVLIISLYNNQIIAHQIYWQSLLNYLSAFIAAIALIKSTGWIKSAISTAQIIGTIYALTTILFLFIPEMGAFQYSFWGYYPNGTNEGTTAYVAGLAANHSANAIYIVVALTISVAKIFRKLQLSEKVTKSDIFWLSCLVIAILLTTKRGHLLFSLLAIVLCYFFGMKGNIKNKFIYFLGIAVLLLSILMVAMYFIPELNATFIRLFDDSGDISMGRFNFWKYAIMSFKENTLFGIGWFGFRFIDTNTAHTYGYFDCHNVYIQLLCETGIVGFIITVISMFVSLKNAIISSRSVVFQNTDEKKNDDLADVYMFSSLFQIFCLLYSLTGNMLYDRTFMMYIMSIAMIWSVQYQKKMGLKLYGE
ncbi:MAG: O-antigen ligase family protein [Clostridia bacterium]|nr:O-antigen ligase family protein [Clostridia bacterium]